MKHFCEVCKKETVLELMPDYSSSGIWCNNCGVNYANPKESLSLLPDWLIRFIQGWNDIWELSVQKEVNPLKFTTPIDQIGRQLLEYINKYYECIIWTDE